MADVNSGGSEMLLIAVVAIALASTQAVQGSVAQPLAGRWVSTVVVEPGEAPAIEPALEVAIVDGRIEVSLGGKPAIEAQAYSAGRGRLPFLMVRNAPTLRGSRLLLIRPVSADEMQVELFHDAGSGERGRFYYAEVFKRAR